MIWLTNTHPHTKKNPTMPPLKFEDICKTSFHHKAAYNSTFQEAFQRPCCSHCLEGTELTASISHTTGRRRRPWGVPGKPPSCPADPATPPTLRCCRPQLGTAVLLHAHPQTFMFTETWVRKEPHVPLQNTPDTDLCGKGSYQHPITPLRSDTGKSHKNAKTFPKAQ